MQFSVILTQFVSIFALLATGTSAFAGIYEPQVIWSKKEIRVCFYDQPSQLEQTPIQLFRKEYPFKVGLFAKHEKKWIDELVVENFTPEDTKAVFIGWQDCSQIKDFDLIIIKAEAVSPLTEESFMGMAPIGQAGIRMPDGKVLRSHYLKSYLVVSKLDPMTIVHELGHVLGLRHEHIHPDTVKDTRCTNKGTTQFERSSPAPTAVVLTQYDAESIMNYCVTQDPKRNKKSGWKFLSELDKQTLRTLYQNK